MSAYDTLLSDDRTVMFHGPVVAPWMEPGQWYTVGGKRCKLTTYAKAKRESGDWKRTPDWYKSPL